MYELILNEVADPVVDPVATIKMNRPEALNTNIQRVTRRF